MTLLHTTRCAGLTLSLVSALLLSQSIQAADNMQFKGALVNAPCTLHPGDEELELDFQTVIDRYLYRYSETPTRPFSLRLDDCDTAVMNGAELKFTGTESPELSGFLAFDAGSTASGAAIGLQTAAGQPLLVNGTALSVALVPGNMEIALQAYLKAEPTARINEAIALGSFRATTHFTLEYQ